MRDKTGGAPSPTVTLTRDSKLGDSTPHVLAPAAPEPTAPALDPFVFDIMEPSPVLAVALRGREGGATAELSGEIQPALRTGGGGGDKPHVLTPAPVAFTTEQTPKFNDDCALTKQSPTGGGQIQSVMQSGMVVRRLTPRECERLQGFPDDFSRIPWKNKPAVDCPDGPRYKALGNSMAVPCMRWIGRRIAAHVAALEAEK
jgi:DNA (cytosine-5)-methyltransferase 1